MKSPAFQFYPADYLADMKVRMLSWASRGLYMDLLCYCWREGWIPADSSAIAQLCHCHDLAIVEPCLSLFDPHPEESGKLVHSRLDRERSKQKQFSEERKSSGIKGAAKRWGADSSAIKQPLAKNGSSSSSTTSSSDTTPTPKQKPESKRLPTTPEAIRISQHFRRRLTTEWDGKEIKAFKSISPIDPQELDLVLRYEDSERSKGDEGWHKRDLITFLNQFGKELDRARAWEQNPTGTAPAKKRGFNGADLSL